MHAERCGSMLVSERLLSQAISVHTLPQLVEVMRLLLSQANAMPAVQPDVVVSRQLLPQTVSAVLLAGESRASLPSLQRYYDVSKEFADFRILAAVYCWIEVAGCRLPAVVGSEKARFAAQAPVCVQGINHVETRIRRPA
jgi:hypothetical protein